MQSPISNIQASSSSEPSSSGREHLNIRKVVHQQTELSISAEYSHSVLVDGSNWNEFQYCTRKAQLRVYSLIMASILFAIPCYSSSKNSIVRLVVATCYAYVFNDSLSTWVFDTCCELAREKNNTRSKNQQSIIIDYHPDFLTDNSQAWRAACIDPRLVLNLKSTLAHSLTGSVLIV